MQLYRMTLTTSFGHNVAVWAEDEEQAEELVLQAHAEGKLKFTPDRMCCPEPDIDWLDGDYEDDPCVVLNSESKSKDEENVD